MHLWVQEYIVLDGDHWAPGEENIYGGRVEPASQQLHLPTYDSPGGSTDQRFRLL